MNKKIPSEEIAQEFFQKLDFTILGHDYNGQKKGADFFIGYADTIQSVEVKSGKWQIYRDIPIPQFNRILDGGLLVVVENGKVVDIKTKEDIEAVSPPNRIVIKWKKSKLQPNVLQSCSTKTSKKRGACAGDISICLLFESYSQRQGENYLEKTRGRKNAGT